MSAVPVEGFEVGDDPGDLDAVGVLEAAAENERVIGRLELRRLELAYQWAVLHPASVDTGVETWDGPAMLGGHGLDESLGGDGTPAVAGFTPEELAAALGMSPAAGAQLIGDVLDLRHRLPLLWKRLRRLEVPAWQARRVAQQTHRLPLAGARWVDQRLAARGSWGPKVTDRLVAEAAAKFDPEAHADREADAQANWDVNLSTPQPTDYAGTSDLTAAGDTLTLKAFYDLVCAIAHQLHLDGDTDPLGVRKVRAIGLVTALVTAPATALATGQATGQATRDATTVLGTQAKRAGRVKVYVHVDAADLDVDGHGGSAYATGVIEKLGAATLTMLRSWVGHHQVVIRPVLNMDRRDAVDGHDPPEWMTDLVRLRDQHCVFPRCQVDAADCDLDHENPYIPTDEGGPPGQTHPDALACLCRRHHRAKTAKVWRYQRTPDGYLWHGPHGTTYLVTPDGTSRVS